MPARTNEGWIAVAPLAAGQDFAQSAKVEFQASLQLLAERARVLTGSRLAAIALRRREGFFYCALAGEDRRKIGDEANTQAFRQSILERKPIYARESTSGDAFLIMPIAKTITVGFFELRGQRLGAPELASIAHLEEMATTAIEHLEAAEQVVAEALAAGTVQEDRPVAGLEPLTAQLVVDGGRMKVREPVHTCKQCGFPVSDRRSLCLDCEERVGNQISTPTEGLFHLGDQESWLSANRYTIASLLLAALAAAAVYWLH